MSDAPIGVLLTQLGTPASTATRDVRRYLRSFLSDPYVIDLPAPARWLLVNGVIAPFRAPRSAEAYRAIWTPEGSPLLVYSRALEAAVAQTLGPAFRVALGMRYGEPSLAGALGALAAAGCARLLVLPLFPQEAASSSGTAVARVEALAAERPDLPGPEVIPPFFDEPGFVAAVVAAAQPVLEQARPDHVLLSYHGLPERHVRRADPTGTTCLATPTCCDALGGANAHCYRAQCFATSRAVAARLGLPPERTSTSFQSRLGRDPWIGPATDAVLPQLAQAGVKRLAVLCPSFVADCLETLEEIGLRAREQWRELGGEELALAPCVNASPPFVEAVADLVRRAAGR